MLLVLLLTIGSICLLTAPADALPVFAKKYNVPCTVCHEAFPKLNDFGIAFRDRGYQMGTEVDTPSENLVFSPFTFRTTPIYDYMTTTGVPTDQSNSTTVSTGTFNLTSLDVLSAGVLAKDISYLTVITPFLDNQVDLESIWIRFSNLLDTGWLNVKIGKHELDIPFTEKRAFGLTNAGGNYLIYNYHPGGPANMDNFALGENQYGIELMGHSIDSRIRYILDLNNGSQPGANQNQGKKPNLYGNISMGIDQEMTSERFGLFGDYGYWPTTFQTVGGAPLSGTGSNDKASSRIGADAFLNLGSSGTPLATLAVQYVYGIDDGSLIGQTSGMAGSQGGTRDAVFSGGTVELNWMPVLKTVIFSHYDWVFNKQQADTGVPSDYYDQSSFTLGARYYIHQSAFTLVALHGEWSNSTIKKANVITGDDAVTNEFLLGVDYAF